MRKKKVNAEPIAVNIEKFSHDGRGIARVDGKTTFVSGALADEAVTMQYKRRKKDFDEGVTLSVEKASPFRVDAKCPHYAMCGGCSLQHLDLQKQIDVKQELLLDLLQRYAKLAPQSILEPLRGEAWNYRNKARLSVRYVSKKGDALVGFRERDNSRFIADIHDCLILNKQVASSIDALRKLISSFTDPTTIAQIEVAAGDDEVALIFRNLAELTDEDKVKLKQFAIDYNFRIYLQPKGPDSVFLFHPETASEYLNYSLPDFSINYQFKPTDFTQVNSAINRKMVKQAIELLDLNENDKVLDLFCGLGNFSLAIAKHANYVYGVEGSQDMVERASMNMRHNSLSNAEFFACDLDQDFATLVAKFAQANKILLDPPRSGAYAVVKQIGQLAIERIVYVSCNPVTLARDTDILVNEFGYKLISAGVMDMFPNTAHVESIALFVKD